jgi:hypothetical protein
MLELVTIMALFVGFWALNGGYRRYMMRKVWATDVGPPKEYVKPLFSDAENKIFRRIIEESVHTSLYSENLISKRARLEKLPGFDAEVELKRLDKEE